MSGFKVQIKAKPAVNPAALAAFAAGADVTPAVLDDKRRVARFQLRLTDLEMAKLKEKVGTGSMHEFCLGAIRAALM